MGLLRGIDVSHWQGEIDWRAVAGAGIAFAWIKATDGVGADDYFAANWSGALYLGGLDRGAYHFLNSSHSAAEQAAAFLRIYPGGGELPAVLDYEHDAHGLIPPAEMALAWLEIVARETGAPPMVYVSPAVADVYLRDERFAAYELWVAHYGVKAPRVPRPWKAWRAWQTGVARVAGIKGDVDLDVMRD